MLFFYIKALHIIFIITWFAGLFYIVRLFIYHTEANAEAEPKRSILLDQYKVMMNRLWYIITWPSAILTLIFGPWTLYMYGSIPGWMWTKLCFVLGLYVYHFFLHSIYKGFEQNRFKYSSTQLRIWNEVATLFLVAIVFLVVVKSMLSMVWGVVGLILFGITLMLAIKLYKSIREKKSRS